MNIEQLAFQRNIKARRSHERRMRRRAFLRNLPFSRAKKEELRFRRAGFFMRIWLWLKKRFFKGKVVELGTVGSGGVVSYTGLGGGTR